MIVILYILISILYFYLFIKIQKKKGFCDDVIISFGIVFSILWIFYLPLAGLFYLAEKLASTISD